MTTVSEGDRELLELAAKAAGYSIVWGEVHRVGDTDVDCTDLAYIVSSDREEAPVYWNPWDDDGDAMRLAVQLRFSVQINEASVVVYPPQDDAGVTPPEVYEYPDGDYDADCRIAYCNHDAATRRAIVRAAASIGKEKP